jgi:type IV pilus assembly protein PilC
MRVLEKQEKNPSLKETIQKIAISVEGGSTFSEALGQHPKIFNKLFVSMVKAGEMGGVLEVVLLRLAEFMEKAQKIKGKVVAAMFYPIAVLVVAVAIMAVLMVVVIPKFKEIFSDLAGKELPGFTVFVLNVSATVQHHFLETCVRFLLFLSFSLLLRLRLEALFDKFKLVAPVFGPDIEGGDLPIYPTLGTLVSSGVPILQSLNIVQETSGNVIVANAVHSVHENVKEGENITSPLESSKIFPPMVISMVDVGEQTGALPEMLMKIADNYDEEVDNAVAAMTSLLEPVMIVFLAVIVGSIVIAMFMP